MKLIEIIIYLPFIIIGAAFLLLPIYMMWQSYPWSGIEIAATITSLWCVIGIVYMAATNA